MEAITAIMKLAQTMEKLGPWAISALFAVMYFLKDRQNAGLYEKHAAEIKSQTEAADKSKQALNDRLVVSLEQQSISMEKSMSSSEAMMSVIQILAASKKHEE